MDINIIFVTTLLIMIILVSYWYMNLNNQLMYILELYKAVKTLSCLEYNF